MKFKTKNDKKKLAEENINLFFGFVEKNFNKDYEKFYIKNIKEISKRFNMRLTREQKLKFCKKCNTFLTVKTREIRANKFTKTIDYVCKNCGYQRRFRYN